MEDVFGRLVTYVFDPAIFLIFSLGFLYFLFGIVVFLQNGANPEKKEEGKQHMIWGIVGMFIMVSVGGIISIIDNTFQLHTGETTQVVNQAQQTGSSVIQLRGTH
ncbi:MAG TPA: hypothetical protein VFL98_00065 [Candidatus Paceibacterota bacterium]|nr:hypothetical protein [Candidatus Paceibacterota bacterium]